MKFDWKTMDSAPKDGRPLYLWAMIGEFPFRARMGYFDKSWNDWFALEGKKVRLKFPTYWADLPGPEQSEI